MNLKGKRVLVVGLGVSGFATAQALRAMGALVKVTEASNSDAIAERAGRLLSEGIDVEIDGHRLGSLDFDVAVVSPGIPPSSEIVRALRAGGVEITGEIELAAKAARCDLLAVTGTNGKTTTTSLLAAMLAEAGVPSTAAGNIGRPLIEAVAEVGEGGAIAVEVSSFQLESTETFHPKVAVLLNVSEDHMDWHGTFAAYAAAKARITENQSPDDHFVFNADDDTAAGIAQDSPARRIPFSIGRVPRDGVGVEHGTVVAGGRALLAVEDLSLLGAAGLEDAIAAAAAALAYGLDPTAIVRALKGFRPLHHRMELVAEVDGIRYIDDSKATNPHATLAAVKGLSDVVLIAGGRSKGIDLTSLRGTVPPVVGVVALGEARDEVERVFAGVVPVEVVSSMSEAVEFAAKLVSPGGSVLLSPACASLDMYESYAQRGEDFARAVRQLLETGQEGSHGEP